MAKTRGRTAGFQMPDEHRRKIQNSSILSALIEHAEGRRKMDSTQVSAALGLLRKVLPDLSSTALTNADGGPLVIQAVRFGEGEKK